MIYLKAGNLSILVLEPGNIDRLKEGKPLTSPDEAVTVCYTPDMTWTMAKLRGLFEKDNLNSEVLEEVLKEGINRPEVRDRPWHPLEMHTRNPHN